MTTPSALQKIKEIERKYRHHSLCPDPVVWDEINTLLLAFETMKEITLEEHVCCTCRGEHMGECSGFDAEFEERMKESI